MNKYILLICYFIQAAHPQELKIIKDQFFHQIIYNRAASSVRFLKESLNKYPELLEETDGRNTPLLCAIEFGRPSLISYFLSKGADFKAKNFSGENASKLCCRVVYSSLSKMIKSWALTDPNKLDQDAYSLWQFINNKEDEALSQMIVEWPDTKKIKTMERLLDYFKVHESFLSIQSEILQQRLRAFTIFDRFFWQFKTYDRACISFFQAIKNHDIKKVKILLHLYPFLMHQLEQGQSPLHLAAKADKAKILATEGQLIGTLLAALPAVAIKKNSENHTATDTAAQRFMAESGSSTALSYLIKAAYAHE